MILVYICNYQNVTLLINQMSKIIFEATTLTIEGMQQREGSKTTCMLLDQHTINKQLFANTPKVDTSVSNSKLAPNLWPGLIHNLIHKTLFSIKKKNQMRTTSQLNFPEPEILKIACFVYSSMRISLREKKN